MLFLIGLGLSENELTIKALDLCKKCELYADRHTSAINPKIIEYIIANTGKQVTDLSRSEMEEDSKLIIKKAKSEEIAILVGGDPLIATTHKILLIEAKKQNVKIEVIHANSILTTAIGESGLDFYRFGRTCTLPSWSSHYKPVSFYETIYKNYKNKWHTLLLLDYDSKKKETIPIPNVIEILEEAEKKYKKGIITGSRELIIMHNTSLKGAKVILTTMAKAKKLKLDGMNTLIICTTLTEIEKEALDYSKNR